MLVLSRNKEEDVIIINRQTGERITVKVSDVRGDRVRLGFTASQDWRILRSELDGKEPKDDQKKQAQEPPATVEYQRERRKSLLGYRFPITTTEGDPNEV